MAFFIATGTISNDVVRKETRNGVLTTFRLETGAPRGRKLWIDVECWGHLAGTIAHHGAPGRSVNVSGRLTQKSWRDTASGEARQRFVVTAYDVDLISESDNTVQLLAPNSVLLRGTVESLLPTRTVRSGTVSCVRVVEGRAGSKTGRLVLQIEHWTATGATAVQLDSRHPVAALGSLTLRAGNSTACAVAVLDARTLAAT